MSTKTRTVITLREDDEFGTIVMLDRPDGVGVAYAKPREGGRLAEFEGEWGFQPPHTGYVLTSATLRKIADLIDERAGTTVDERTRAERDALWCSGYAQACDDEGRGEVPDDRPYAPVLPLVPEPQRLDGEVLDELTCTCGAPEHGAMVQHLIPCPLARRRGDVSDRIAYE